MKRLVFLLVLCLLAPCTSGWAASGFPLDDVSDGGSLSNRSARPQLLMTAERGGLLKVSEKSRAIARRLERTGYYSRMSRAYKGYPHLRSKKSRASGANRRAAVSINQANRRRYRAQIHEIARAHRLHPDLLDAVIMVESAYEPDAVSAKGAMGLMQLMPDTAARFQVSEPFDPAQNLHGGARYLRWLMDKFDGELSLVLAAYNAGEGAVQRYGNRIPPFPETRAYVARVLDLFQAETGNAPP